ncbi:hypothetical protein KCU77_g112, partial [Aureobasidium melanogenum]
MANTLVEAYIAFQRDVLRCCGQVDTWPERESPASKTPHDTPGHLHNDFLLKACRTLKPNLCVLSASTMFESLLTDLARLCGGSCIVLTNDTPSRLLALLQQDHRALNWSRESQGPGLGCSMILQVSKMISITPSGPLHLRKSEDFLQALSIMSLHTSETLQSTRAGNGSKGLLRLRCSQTGRRMNVLGSPARHWILLTILPAGISRRCESANPCAMLYNLSSCLEQNPVHHNSTQFLYITKADKCPRPPEPSRNTLPMKVKQYPHIQEPTASRRTSVGVHEGLRPKFVANVLYYVVEQLDRQSAQRSGLFNCSPARGKCARQGFRKEGVHEVGGPCRDPNIKGHTACSILRGRERSYMSRFLSSQVVRCIEPDTHKRNSSSGTQTYTLALISKISLKLPQHESGISVEALGVIFAGHSTSVCMCMSTYEAGAIRSCSMDGIFMALAMSANRRRTKTKDKDAVCGMVTLPVSVFSISTSSKLSAKIGSIMFPNDHNEDSSVSKVAPYQKRKACHRSEPRPLLKRLQFALALTNISPTLYRKVTPLFRGLRDDTAGCVLPLAMVCVLPRVTESECSSALFS